MAKEYKYDAFISHAVEDKLAIANDLARGLEEAGLSIWYSGSELNAGDSIDKVIQDGLHRSRYGIVILSKNYLDKNWTMKELHFLMSKEGPERKVILPVLFDVSPEDLAAKDINLADRYGLRADGGMGVLVKKLVAEINKGKQTEKKEANRRARRRWVAGVTALIILSGSAYTGTQFYHARVQGNDAEAVVAHHIAGLESRIKATSMAGLPDNDRQRVRIEGIRQLFQEFSEVKSYYRNTYLLVTADTTIRFRKNVERALAIDLETLLPANNFGMTDPVVYLVGDSLVNGVRQVRYSVENTAPLTYSQEESGDEADHRRVRVFYHNNIRTIDIAFEFPDDKGIKRYSVTIYGFPPRESYVLDEHGQ